jgi:hypothetical protein
LLTPGRHAVNTTVRIAVNFQDDNGTDVDPSGVSFRLYSPSATDTTYTYGTDIELVRLNTGDYVIDVVPNESGRWHYRWLSTGTGTSIALEGSFVVQSSVFFDDPTTDAYR